MNGYQTIGQGPRRVMALHGWFGDEHFLEPMRPNLSARDFTYCCMAIRGYGASKHITGDFTLDEIAADALALADELGWDRFAVMGHSMGGKAAQKLMLRAPDRVSALVALTPVPAGAVPFDEPGWALFSGAADDLAKREAIIQFSTGHRLGTTWVQALAQRSLQGSTRDAFAAYLPAWVACDFHAEVMGATTPLLAVVGEHDPQLNEAAMRATFLQWYPNATLEVMANAGHYPMDETPVALACTIERFLALHS